jgi:L-2-hydroxyglutarate oxidase LhgO
MPEKTFEVAVIGGGIAGTATAMAILRRHPISLALIEKEDRLAAHQTGNNSGVIHWGCITNRDR